MKITAQQSQDAWARLMAEPPTAAILLKRYLSTPERIPTGIGTLDEALQGGIKQGAVTIVAGTPGAGKTALAVQLAANATKSRPVLFASGELSAAALWFRLASLRSLKGGDPVPYGTAEQKAKQLRELVRKEFCGTIPQTEADYERVAQLDPMAQALTRAANAYGCHLAIKDDLLTMTATCNLAASLSALEPPPLLFVDYLQMFSRDGGNNQYEAITAASHALIDLVRQTGLGAVVLSSMNRENSKNSKAGKDNAPSLESLRGSGDIGFDADTVIILATDPDRPEPHAGARGIIAHIVKQRTGPQSQVPLEFWPAYGLFNEPGINPATLRADY